MSIDSDPENFDPANLPKTILDAVEADSFWCLSRLLDGIQDNYIFAQPGIQRSVRRMAELVARIDGTLCVRTPKRDIISDFSNPFSSTPHSSRRPKRGIHAVRLPLDELPPNA